MFFSDGMKKIPENIDLEICFVNMNIVSLIRVTFGSLFLS
jgi:hypothetical protein